MKCEHLHVFDTIDLLITNYCTVSALTVSTATLHYEAYGIDKIITIMLFNCVSLKYIFMWSWLWSSCLFMFKLRSKDGGLNSFSQNYTAIQKCSPVFNQTIFFTTHAVYVWISASSCGERESERLHSIASQLHEQLDHIIEAGSFLIGVRSDFLKF